jgi:hypothetical protein
MNKETFKVKVGEQEIELAVLKPLQEHFKEAQSVFNTIYWEALNPDNPKDKSRKVLIRGKVDEVLRRMGVWDDDKDKELRKLDTRLLENIRKLLNGGKLSHGYDIAIQILKDRAARVRLLSIRNEIDSNTAEAQAENAKFNKLVQLCLVYNDGDKDGQPYYDNFNDFLNRTDEEAAQKAYSILMKMIYKTDPNQINLPEYKFLRKHGFMDKDGRLLSKDKKYFVNFEGKRVNEDGLLVNDKDEIIDEEGNVLGQKVSVSVTEDDNAEPEYEDDLAISPV